MRCVIECADERIGDALSLMSSLSDTKAELLPQRWRDKRFIVHRGSWFVVTRTVDGYTLREVPSSEVQSCQPA